MADIDKGPSLFKNTKFRAVFVVGLVVIIAGLVFGYLGYRRSRVGDISVARVGGTPDIESIPGGDATTVQYAKDVSQSNVEQAKEAAKKGEAAVPTLVRATYQGPTDFPGIISCDTATLRRARAAGVSATELRCKGCGVKALLAAGYTLGDLMGAGASAKLMREAGVSCPDLLKSGYSVAEVRAAGYDARELTQCLAGFDIAAMPKDCSAEELEKAREKGVSAKAIRDKLNCSASQLRAAGYTAGQLKAAGFTAKQLADAGFNAKQLRDAGFTAAQLRAAGFTPDELRNAGFTTGDLLRAGFSPDQVVPKGVVAKDCSVAELEKAREAGVSANDLYNTLGCSASQMLAAGYTPQQLASAGYTRDQLAAAGVPASVLDDLDYPYMAKNCSPAELKKSREAGIPARVIREKLNCTASAMRAAGYSAKQLLAGGYTPEQIRAAGYSPTALASAGIAQPTVSTFPKDCSQESLKKAREAGISATAIKTRLNCSAKSLAQAGYTASELRAAGYTPQELLAAGFTPKQLLAAGFTPDQLLAAGVSAAQLAAAGVSPAQAALPTLATTGDTPVSALEKLRQEQASELSAQQRQDLMQALQSAMLGQARELITIWAPPAAQNYVAGKQEQKDQTAAGGAAAGAARPGAKGAPGAGQDQQEIAYTLKAGTVKFAVLDTGINSDEQSPILATIVSSGPLKGAKLIGQFTRVDKRVLISFNKISLPGLKDSIPINAVAIDPNTARTAVADRVNSHYLLRYGSLFGSAFLSGIAQALSQQGSTTVSATDGSVTRTFPPLNTTEKALVALGNVGTQYGTVLGQNFNTPPTVKVNSGSSIGILLMNDLKVPKDG